MDNSSDNRGLLNRQPVGIPDWSAYLAAELAAPDSTLSAADREWYERVASHYRSGVGVPLIVKDKLYGMLVFYYRERRESSDEDYRLGMSLADQAALAIENARLRAQAGQSAAFEERSRLARELHDSVTQSLYSVALYAEAAARLLKSGEHMAAADHLRELRDTAQEALREMRLLIFELRPPALEKNGLAAALQARLDAVEKRAGIQAELKVEGEELLPHAVQEELYRIAREALNNVLRHANARTVRVQLEFNATTCLRLCDDGIGFDPAQVRGKGGLGLPGMKERAQKIGADLQIESAPGKGTQIKVTVAAGRNF